MKLLDEVKLIKDREEYSKENIFSGMIGTIIDADIRLNRFNVNFQDQKIYEKDFKWTDENISNLKDDTTIWILIDDLQVVKDGNCSDECIKNSLPEKHPNWQCKVEDGYILNLLGEKKNNEPYKYNS